MTNLAAKTPITIALNTLFVAPENAREHIDVADEEGLQEFASSLDPDSSGQLIAIFVRLPIDDEAPGHYVLDGRRRLGAFRLLLDAGRINEAHPVTAILCETEEEITAACVTANAQRSELSHADTLIAINKQTRAGRSLEAIAKILCADIKDVARQSKLGGLDIRFLKAYKSQRINLQTLKKLTAVTNGEALAELADQQETNGGNLYYWQVDRLLAVRESVESPVFNYLTLDDYRAKGGRVEEDLFETVGDAVLDPKILHDLFESKFKKTLKAIRSTGVEVVFLPKLNNDLTLEARVELPYSYQTSTPGGVLEAVDEKINDAMITAAEAIQAGEGSVAVAQANELLRLRFERARLETAPVELAAIHFGLNAEGQFEHIPFVQESELEAHLEAQALARLTVRDDDALAGEESEDGEGNEGDTEISSAAISVPAIEVETEGLSAAVHGRLTTLAGLGLASSLAGNPVVAFDLHLATLLSHVSDRTHANLSDFVLQVRPVRQISDLAGTEDTLTAPIIAPLKEVIAQWQASGTTAFTFIQTQDMAEKLEILALITALQVSMTESATFSLRKKARVEAALVAGALGHDMANVYSGDATFYSQFTKGQLLDFVTQMEGNPDVLRSAKKDLIVGQVTEMADAKRWVPPHLNFRLARPPVDEDAVVDDIIPFDEPIGQDADHPEPHETSIAA